MEFNPSELVIIAGRPAVGKTTLALTMLYNLAVERSIPSAIFSMEMSVCTTVFRKHIRSPKATKRESDTQGMGTVRQSNATDA